MWVYVSLCIIPIISTGYFGYLISKYILLRNVKFVNKIFNQETSSTNFPIYLESEKWKIFISYIFFIILNSFIFIGSRFIFKKSDDGYLQYVLSNSIIYTISIISIFYFIYIILKRIKLIKFVNFTDVKEFIRKQLIIAKNYQNKSYDVNWSYFNKYRKYLELVQTKYINKINYSLNYIKLYKLFLKYIRGYS